MIGVMGEDIASKYIQNKGYIILRRNLYSRFGEIDIVATKSQKIFLFEVKTTKSSYNIISNVNKYKIEKIKKTFFKKYAVSCEAKYGIRILIINLSNDIKIMNYGL